MATLICLSNNMTVLCVHLMLTSTSWGRYCTCNDDSHPPVLHSYVSILFSACCYYTQFS